MLKIKIYVVLNNFWEFFFHKQFFCQCETKEKKSFFFGKIKKIAKSCSKSRTNRSEQLREKKIFFSTSKSTFPHLPWDFFFHFRTKKNSTKLVHNRFFGILSNFGAKYFFGQKNFCFAFGPPLTKLFFWFFSQSCSKWRQNDFGEVWGKIIFFALKMRISADGRRLVAACFLYPCTLEPVSK